LTDGVPEVFYALLPEARGRGAATSAVRALCHWLGSLGHGEVALETIEGNIASERVAVRAGFLPSGRRPDLHHGEPVVLNRWLWRPAER